MSVIFILIGFSLTVAAGFLVAYIWAAKTGQYDDDCTPAIRILFDDEPKQSINGSNPRKEGAKSK